MSTPRIQAAIILVLPPQQAQELQVLARTGTLELAVVKPGDKDNSPNTTAVTPADVASAFKFH